MINILTLILLVILVLFTFFKKSILFSPFLFLLVLLFINTILNKKEKFIQCNDNNHLMEPIESEDYIDPSIKESKLTNIGSKGSKYPFDYRYIPKTNKKWCLKSVLNQ